MKITEDSWTEPAKLPAQEHFAMRRGRCHGVTGKRPVKDPPDSEGMTLIEVLAALAVISLLAVAVSATLVNASGWNRLAADETKAVAYAAEMMEAIRASAGRLPGLSGSTYSVGLGNWSDLAVSTSGERDGMQAQVSVSGYEIDAGLYRVDVEVSWETVGKPHVIQLTGVIWAGQLTD